MSFSSEKLIFTLIKLKNTFYKITFILKLSNKDVFWDKYNIFYLFIILKYIIIIWNIDKLKFLIFEL